jgi:hypothetical protein
VFFPDTEIINSRSDGNQPQQVNDRRGGGLDHDDAATGPLKEEKRRLHNEAQRKRRRGIMRMRYINFLIHTRERKKGI